MSKTNVLIDVATAGASGDMFLSALLDLIGENDALTPVAASPYAGSGKFTHLRSNSSSPDSKQDTRRSYWKTSGSHTR